MHTHASYTCGATFHGGLAQGALGVMRECRFIFFHRTVHSWGTSCGRAVPYAFYAMFQTRPGHFDLLPATHIRTVTVSVARLLVQILSFCGTKIGCHIILIYLSLYIILYFPEACTGGKYTAREHEDGQCIPATLCQCQCALKGFGGGKTKDGEVS